MLKKIKIFGIFFNISNFHLKMQGFDLYLFMPLICFPCLRVYCQTYHRDISILRKGLSFILRPFDYAQGDKRGLK